MDAIETIKANVSQVVLRAIQMIVMMMMIMRRRRGRMIMLLRVMVVVKMTKNDL